MIKNIINIILNLPKRLWINFAILPLNQAVCLPINIHRSVKLKNISRNSIVINSDVRKSMIKIGFPGPEGVAHSQKGCILMGDNSKIIFCGNAAISQGILMRLSGTITFGRNFYSNCNLSLICANDISFGDDCILGWNVHIRDCDGHSLYQIGRELTRIRLFKSTIMFGLGRM